MDYLELINAAATEIWEVVQILLIIYLLIENRRLSNKYHILNTLFAEVCLVIHLKLGVKLVKKHRNGDFELINVLFEDQS